METKTEQENIAEISKLVAEETLTPTENKTSKIVSTDLYKECLTPECDC